MKKFVLLICISVFAGTAAGWTMNYVRYGHRSAKFGPITGDRKVTAENALATLEQDLPDGLAKVEMISDTHHDFGVMAPDEEGEHAFVIKNVGEKPLSLRIGASSCKCTIGSLDKDSLEPGEEAEVKLSWTVKTDSSEFSQSAQLLTNDPSKVVIDLMVSGRVVRQIEMVPKSWSFGEIATGEPITLTSTIYNYMDHDIEPSELTFTSDEMNELSDFQVEPYTPNPEQDGVHAAARQAFRVEAKIREGLRQGPVSQNFLFGFRRVAGNGKHDDSHDSPSTQEDHSHDSVADQGEESESGVFTAATTGRIVGVLSMIPNPKLSGRSGGGYVYNFGRLKSDDDMTAKAYVVLKGAHRENTRLRVGNVTPEGVIEASLGKRLGKGSMDLYPLELRLIPGEVSVERLGNNKSDYGTVRIESDNPEVPGMKLGVKFAIPARRSP